MTFHELLPLVYTGRLVPIIAYVGMTLLAFFVLAHNTKAAQNRIFAVMALTAAAWNVAFFLYLGADDAEQAIYYSRLYDTAVLALVPTWTYFAMHFAGRVVSPMVVYAPSLAFLPFLHLTGLIYGSVEKVGGYFFTRPGSDLFILYNIYLMVFILYGITELVRAHASSSDIDRQRIKWMTIGIGFPVVAGTIDILLSIAQIDVLSLSPAASVPMIFFVGYAFLIGGEE